MVEEFLAEEEKEAQIKRLVSYLKRKEVPELALLHAIENDYLSEILQTPSRKLRTVITHKRAGIEAKETETRLEGERDDTEAWKQRREAPRGSEFVQACKEMLEMERLPKDHRYYAQRWELWSRFDVKSADEALEIYRERYQDGSTS